MTLLPTAARFLTLGLLAAAAGCSPSTPQLPPLADEAVILAFGNSLTFGTGARTEESYPAVLEALTGRRVVNAGVPGEVSADGLRRLPAVLDDTAAGLVVLCHGGNDILRKQAQGQLQQNLKDMIRMAQGRGASVVLLGVPLPGLFLSSADLYEDVAEALGVPFEGDVIPSTLGDNRLKSDTIHPNKRGYRRIAEAVRDLLEEAGAL